MKARRFVSRGTVALVSFLLVASLADSASRVASARRQAEQKDVQQKPDAQGVQQKTDKQKAEPATQQTPEQGDKSAPKASVPAANGRASSSSAPADGSGPVVVTDDDERKPVITHTDLVTLTVTVTDAFGRFVTGLNQKAFTVTDEKVPQEITFFSDEDAPVSLGIVFDVSGSMSGDKIMRAREALSKFIETSHWSDGDMPTPLGYINSKMKRSAPRKKPRRSQPVKSLKRPTHINRPVMSTSAEPV